MQVQLINPANGQPLREGADELCDSEGNSFPIIEDQYREWVVLDTFDMFSPAYDNPQRKRDVARMFERSGATVSFASFVDVGSARGSVVRAIRD